MSRPIPFWVIVLIGLMFVPAAMTDLLNTIIQGIMTVVDGVNL